MQLLIKHIEIILNNKQIIFVHSKVANPGESPGNRYNIQLINALVMHVGTSAIQFIRSKGNIHSLIFK